MGFLNKVKTYFNEEVFKENQSYSTEDPLLSALLGGTEITRAKALSLPKVSSNVDLIGGMIATIPIKLYKKEDGKITEIVDDYRTKIINAETGDLLDGYQWKKAMVEDYLLGKGAYSFVEWSKNKITGLYYIECDKVSPQKNIDAIHKKCSFIIDAKVYSDYRIFRVLRNTKDGVTSKGLLEEVTKAIETAYATMLYELNLVKKGGNKKGFLKSDRKISDESIKVLKDSWKRMYTTNEENVVVLNNGIDFKESSNSSVEMQLNQSKTTLDNQLDSIFHIKNNFDDTFKEAILPIIKAFESACNRFLLLEREKKENYYFVFDTKEITKASLKERFESYKLAKEIGFMTTNELRQEEKLNEIDGLDVINVGLGAVLYDIEKKEYYTPNTDTISSADGENKPDVQEKGENDE